MRRNATLIFLACAVLLIAGRSAADDVDEKDVVVLGDKNFTEGLKKSKFALVRAGPMGSLPLTLMRSNRSGDRVFPCGGHRRLMRLKLIFYSCRWSFMPHGVDTARI